MSHPHSHPQAVITDQDALNGISPDQLRGYLTAAGWRKVEDIGLYSKSTLWDKKRKRNTGSWPSAKIPTKATTRNASEKH